VKGNTIDEKITEIYLVWYFYFSAMYLGDLSDTGRVGFFPD